MAAREEIVKLLKKDGATIIRQKTHVVYKLSNGNIFVRACTPSNTWTGDRKNLNDLRFLLGIVPENRGEPGERREKKGKRHESVNLADLSGRRPGRNSEKLSLADQLRATGVVEDALRRKNESLERQNALLIEELSETCFACITRAYIKQFIRNVRTFYNERFKWRK